MAGNSEMTVIGADTTIKGEMEFRGGARVLGVFEGKISAGGELQVGESATCNAELVGARVVVEGSVNGNIAATDRLTLNATADIDGDIAAGELVVVEGAKLKGFCSIGPDAVEQAASKAVEKKAADKRAAAKHEPKAEASTPWSDAGDPPLIETTKNGATVLSSDRRVVAD